MTNEPFRPRQAEQQQAGPRRSDRNQGASDPNLRGGSGSGQENKGISRRTLFMLGGGAAVAAAGAYALSRRPTFDLPIPDGQIVGPEYLAATLSRQAAPTTPMPSDGRGWFACRSAPSGTTSTDLDLVLVVDTTGSMGSVLSDLKLNFLKLVENLKALGGVQVGVVAYKDRCDREVIRTLPLTPLDPQGAALIGGFLNGLQASGGCDWPEKMDAALEAATSMGWRGVWSSVVVVADAPAHREDEQIARDLAQAFHTKLPGAQVSMVDTGSGAHPFMPTVAQSGGGQYVTYNGRILNSLFPAISGCRGV